MMNPDKDHQEHNNILKFIFWSECSPRFSSKSLWDPGYMA